VTLGVRRRIDHDLDPVLARAAEPLPLPVVIGGLLVFARRRSVLALSVVPSSALLAAQQRVHDALVDCEPLNRHGGGDHLAPGRWTPHVTLARGLTAEQVARAVEALGRVDDLEATFVALRRWDGVEHRAWSVSSA
jgi:2'-5' RNA ligase